MPSPTGNTIYPCPLSKGYSIPSDQAWILLTVFSLYRLSLACLFVILFFSQFGPSLLGTYNPKLYTNVSLSYLFTSIIFGACALLRKPDYVFQAQSIIFIDILAITLIMHACGGITSGIGMLLAVTIAAGGLLIGGRCAMLFAVLASLTIIAEQVFAMQTHAFATTAYTYTGVLSAAFITIAFLSYFLALRSEQSERIISQKEQTIHNLEELNEHIIQQLNSGIIITGSDQKISLANEAALKVLNLSSPPDSLSAISEQLATCFQNWRKNQNLDIATIDTTPDNEIHLRFIPLNTRHDTFFMITLEDSGLYNQRLQQGKLASLGQLTASIAHEIRNPLSALNHASQLLMESRDLDPQNLRLTEIIQTHTQRVNKIIEDILQLSRRQPSNRKKINLGDWLQDYLEIFISTNNLDEKLTLVEFDENNHVFIDPDHLKQILDNLSLNAFKYGRQKHGLVLFKVSRDQQSLYLDVIDNGPGVAPDKCKHLFEPFFTTSPTGTGLGLYISKELAELNHANLSYQPPKTGGGCFRLRLSEADNETLEI